MRHSDALVKVSSPKQRRDLYLTPKQGQGNLNSVTPSLASTPGLHTVLVEKVQVVLEQVKKRAERTTGEGWTNTGLEVAMRNLGTK